MPRRHRRLVIGALLVSVLATACGNARSARQAGPGGDDVALQEKQCTAAGWTRTVVQAGGIARELLWKAPTGSWSKGAIAVLHGGGGQHFQWCVANVPLVAPQVAFSELALAQGFAVFLLNSSDQVTDTEGRPCGKVWDDEVRERPNLDLPFLENVLTEVVAGLRPAGSAAELFLTGLSSGGFMSVRAGTHLDDVVTAFAPVAGGDPYGWHRACEPGRSPRLAVHGVGLDNETGRGINERDSCLAPAYPNEKIWDGARTASKPAVRVFRHEQDGIVDGSCGRKLSEQVRAHGYPGPADFVLHGGRRGLANHLWQDAYNQPVLDFFAGQLDTATN